MLIPIDTINTVSTVSTFYLALYLQICVNIYQTFGCNSMCHGSVVRGVGFQLLSVDVCLQSLVRFLWIPVLNSVGVHGSCMDALCLLSKGRSTCLSDSSTGGVVKGNSNGCA